MSGIFAYVATRWQWLLMGRLLLVGWWQAFAGWLVADMDPEMSRDETATSLTDDQTRLRREIAAVVATWGPHKRFGLAGTPRQETIDRVRCMAWRGREGGLGYVDVTAEPRYFFCGK